MKAKTLWEASGMFLLFCTAFLALWRSDRKSEALLLLLSGAAAAAAILYLPIQRKKESLQKYRQELTRDYCDMVTLLSLYMTAGLSLRNSWDKLIEDYDEDREHGVPEKPVYEEMKRTRQEIRSGVFESRAYSEFGLRCGTPEYLRLGGLLETYVKQGNRELLLQLEQEASASLSLAFSEVRKKGEQTGTKLLIPLILLFALTLLLVMIPAMMSLQGTI